ncbi:N-acylglucosamine 2-epimerase [Cupriavidus gilardii]|uniref:AGE family epimerase/isomerase n=1 Tax=Cupriavidus gilardii TaxID=82541 RepID=UPI001EE5F240|nr:AGE family epimerase/isomerase [Cupriavidus gilardii]MCG5262731.1 AGE family epimerase/isomerase [Cupriavidus gilardii]MDF9431596.1 N-acylglucosamine 2-epimerase [Cupriavidus gilardii]
MTRISPSAAASATTAAALSASGPGAAIAALLAHYDTTVLPLWTGPGWHESIGVPYEALAGRDASPLPVQRYRAMACARQLYVFARQPDGLAHADTLFAALRRRFADPDGGWYYSIDADGAPLDTGKDLYTHAFIVFACAAYWRRGGNAQARAVLDDAVALIEEKFGIPGGLYHAALARDFTVERGAVLQNPVMHLTEAYLAAYEATGEDWYAQRLREIARQVQRTFVDPANGCIAELPLGAPDNRIEPGHQFEWYSLLAMAPSVFGACELAESLTRGCAFAQRHGVAQETQGVAAALDAGGRIIDATQRIWAQTEYARALALRGDDEGRAALAAWLAAFPGRFLHARGWHECIGPDDAVLRDEMPSTTPYHLATAYEALRKLAD